MSRHRRPAPERVLALIAALGAAVAGGLPAHAQSDPFALPQGMTAQSVAQSGGPGLSEIAVDGDTRVRLVELAWQGGVLAIDADGARVAGLPIPDSSRGMVPLASLQLAKWTFDSVHQRLEIQLFRNSDAGNLIDLSAPPRMDGVSAPLTALRVDYDLTGTSARGRAGAAGLVEAALVRGNAAITGGFQLSSGSGGGSRPVLRLDSQVQVLFAQHRLTATAGDFISAGGQSQRALRMGGLQLASDYTLQIGRAHV